MDFQEKVTYIYNSNRLDGVHFSEEQTRDILVGAIDPHEVPDLQAPNGQIYPTAAVSSHASAIAFIERLARPALISENNIREIHRRLMDGVLLSNGEYRECVLNVKGLPQVPPARIPSCMQRLVKVLNEGFTRAPRKDEFAWRIHHEFVLIHPFIAGNGRCARLILNLIRFMAGLDVEMIFHVDQQYYLRGIADYLRAKMRMAGRSQR